MSSRITITSPTAHDTRRWLGFFVILSATFLSVLDLLIVNIALPAIQSSIGASDAQIQLSIAGYGLAFAVFLITGGRLGDIYGRRLVFQIGMFGFTAASALCGFAQSPNQLVVFRAIQGLLAALMAPQVLATVQVAFADNERDKATGIIGATLGIGAFLGNVLGGYLIAANLFGLGWRAIFFVNVPIGIVAIILSIFFVPESKSPTAKKLDILGVLISAVALFLLIFPIAEGREQDFPLWALAMIGGCVPVFLLFASHQKRLTAKGGSPLIDMELLKVRGYGRGLVGILLLFSGISSFSLTFALFLQKGMGVKPQEVGVIFSVLSVSFLMASLSAAKLVACVGNKTLLVGLGLMQVTQLALIFVLLYTRGEFNPFWLMPVLFVYGLGQGLSVPQVIRQTISQVELNNAGAAAGMLNTVQQVASSLGVSVIGGVFFAFAENSGLAFSYSKGLAAAFACNVLLLQMTLVLMVRHYKRDAQLHLEPSKQALVTPVITEAC